MPELCLLRPAAVVLERNNVTVVRTTIESGEMQVKDHGRWSRKDINATEVSLGGIDMKVYKTLATKFDKPDDQEKYTHLNIDFNEVFPERATGIFAELSGTKQMSDSTRMMLKSDEVASHAA